MAASSTSRRLTFIDETRAIAIAAMMTMHFGPGVIARIPALEPFASFILVIGRFATPAFIAVFGITAGFVYAHRFAPGNDASRSRRRIHRRAALVLLAAAILVLPRWSVLYDSSGLDVRMAAFTSYSVLSYYVMGLATLPLWLRVIGRDPMRRAPVLGISLWIVHAVLVAIWPHDPSLGFGELVRMHAVSGSYPYFAMTGVALIAMPAGVVLKRAHARGDREVRRVLVRRVLPIGLAVTALGVAWGSGLGELGLQAILDATPKAPARPWYYLMFGGLTLVLLTGVAFMPRIYPLSLMGQGSLEIYTGHAYVIPGLYWLDQVADVHGLYRIALALAVFAGFTTVILLRRHRERTGPALTRA
jgi:hypothetical protein